MAGRESSPLSTFQFQSLFHIMLASVPRKKQFLRKPELICPAGDWPSLKTAVENGADAVYFGVKDLNMRNLAENFDASELPKVIHYLHQHRKKAYLALNVIVYDSELEKVSKILRGAKAAHVDAVILWDLAVFSMAKKMKLNIHLSTQASVANQEALRFYSRLGALRIVLARECALADIRRMAQFIKRKKIRCELETFIHGAMCVSLSGRCFMSQEIFQKSANRGECVQPCRREYLIKERDGESEFVLGQDFVLSPKDLCAIDFIDELIRAGVTGFKIEGRMRSAEYIKVVTSVYRRAVDAYLSGELTDAFKKELRDQLKLVYNRGFSSGFYLGNPDKDVSRRLEHVYQKTYVGEVRNFYGKIMVADVMIQDSGLKNGDQILVAGKDNAVQVARVTEMQKEHQPVQAARRGEKIGVKLPFVVRAKDKIFLWQPTVSKKDRK